VLPTEQAQGRDRKDCSTCTCIRRRPKWDLSLGRRCAYLVSPDGVEILAKRRCTDDSDVAPKKGKNVAGYHSHVLSDEPRIATCFMCCSRIHRCRKWSRTQHFLYDVASTERSESKSKRIRTIKYRVLFTKRIAERTCRAFTISHCSAALESVHLRPFASSEAVWIIGVRAQCCLILMSWDSA